MADTQTPGTGEKQEAAPSNGRWPKGVSGNPKGRPMLPKELREYAGQYTQEALDGLLSIARSEDTPPAVAVKAWEAVLDRGVGKPTQPLEHSGADGGALTVVIHKEQT